MCVMRNWKISRSRPYASAERRHRLLAEVKAVVDEMVAAELRLGLRTKRPASVNWRLARRRLSSLRAMVRKGGASK